MGDVADMMIDGTLCESCGVFLGAGDGFPRQCDSCRGEQLRERETKQHRIDRAGNQFDEARACASAAGLCLVRRGENHYQLSKHGGWLLNLYPSNCRIYSDKNRDRAPFLDFAGVRWTLADVVARAVGLED